MEMFRIQVRAAMQDSAEASVTVDDTEQDGVFADEHICLAVTCGL